jgi:lauroyl/myristoyl acyltransferase
MEAWGCQILAKAIPKLSRHACVGLGQFLGALAYHFDAHGRRIGIANITAALGDRYSEPALRQMVRMSYQNFAVTMLSLFWSSRITEDNAHKYLEMAGFESVTKMAQEEGRGIVFVCAHEGNWEWAALAFSLQVGWASIVVEDFKNPALTDIFVRLRSRDRHRIIPQDKSILKMLRAVLRGESAGLVGDLNLDPSGAAVAIKAFKRNNVGLEMCVSRLHGVLATRGNALLVPVLTLPLPGGRCRVMAQKPIATTEGGERLLCQRTWEVFEAFILEHPELWLWAYKHFKYKPESSMREYPFYAAPNSHFEKMREEIW